MAKEAAIAVWRLILGNIMLDVEAEEKCKAVWCREGDSKKKQGESEKTKRVNGTMYARDGK
jgi:hypothetical protein